MIVQLFNGLAEVPDNLTIINLAEDGKGNDVGVISDKHGELKPLIVVADDEALKSISCLKEEEVISKAIANLPEYQAVKARELPFPDKDADQATWLAWSMSRRLGLCHIEMLEGRIEGYKLVRCTNALSAGASAPVEERRKEKGVKIYDKQSHF